MYEVFCTQRAGSGQAPIDEDEGELPGVMAGGSGPCRTPVIDVLVSEQQEGPAVKS